jgi:NitT/TauT family transport system ATP-binding protein
MATRHEVGAADGPATDTRPPPLVELRHTCVVHGAGRKAVVAVEDFSLDVAENEFICLIGPSGCGKSTLLKAIAGLLPERSVQGRITVNGGSPAQARRANAFAFVFQDPVLAPWRTVLANVQLPLEVVGRSAATKGGRSPRELIELVGLRGFEHSLPDQLSGGMRQRVAIARALTLQPSVLLMDEPFGALDELTRDRMQAELLDAWTTTNAAVLLVTHSIIEAAFLADRVAVMTPRPGHLKAVIEVPFPRPRAPELKTQVQFLEKTNEIRAALELPE